MSEATPATPDDTLPWKHARLEAASAVAIDEFSRRDPTQKRNRRIRFWHVFFVRQVFAKLGPSRPERS
jgi:hypothetical protein